MTPDTHHRIAAAILPGLAGALIGWTGNALTLSGQVEALRGSVQRIEVRLDQIAGAVAGRPASEPKK